jgi:hypothetical protein
MGNKKTPSKLKILEVLNYYHDLSNHTMQSRVTTLSRGVKVRGKFGRGRESTLPGRVATNFTHFSAQLCFFPCITVLVKIFSLGAQMHTK